jgi:RES domain-containing protein
MLVYRIAKKKYINDFSGRGASDFGGRWNLKGTAVLYTSETVALATLEYIVNVPLSIVPHDLAIAEIKIPDRIKPKHLDEKKLPRDWLSNPPPLELAKMGTEWINGGKSLLLRAPSAVTRSDFNYLINPGHPDMKLVSAKSRKYDLDDRILEMISMRK